MNSLPWVMGFLAAAGGMGAAVPNELMRDFDGDGVEERLVSGPNGPQILRRNPGDQEWEPADFSLPEGVVLVDEQGRDAGLRFVDLNGDGFDDVLFSNQDRFAIHLWTRNVQPHLGWTKGWSHLVRAGERTGRIDEPPVVAGTEVRVEGEELVVTRVDAKLPAPAGVRRMVRDLIAYQAQPPQSPDEGLASMRVRPGFRVELVAAEPVVVDPVALDWDAGGRLWVVEMRDYPSGMDGQGKPGGVVKVLEDRDGDGRYEKASTFLEGIGFPTGVLSWRRGVLISAAPDVLYAEDTDGDGRADLREVLLTGFKLWNQQHLVNGFEPGLDGWVYLANGDSGGEVKSLKTGATLSISGRDLRFRPDTGELETVSVQTQFGLRRDDWGNWFGNNNPTWLWHVTVPEHYLRRNPKLAVRSLRKVLANYEDFTRVFPVSPALVRPNQPWSLNHVTSACSPTPYRDDLFGEKFATSVFISEPVHNVVHREVLAREGASFTSRRAEGEERSEFLASTDNWFRPAGMRVGPDGALYIADMYRLVIEHPEWISPEMQARVDLRAGSDRGRIYRVVSDGKARRAIPDLSGLGSGGLVRAMNSPSGWQRDTAQRLLIERGDGSVAPALGELLSPTHAPQVRLQALATLGVLGVLEPAALLKALEDPHPGVRCEALRQSERFGGKEDAVFESVRRLAADGEPAVRLQAAFSLGAWPVTITEPVLRDLAARVDADELLRTAVMSSLSPGSRLFQELNLKDPRTRPAPSVLALTPSSSDRAKVVATYRGVSQLTGDPKRGLDHFRLLCAPCHRLRGEGHEVGPDLAMVASKPPDWLVAAILDPEQAVEARFAPWTVELKSGDEISGILAAETANNIVVRVAGGADHAVLRSDIQSMTRGSLSLMPSGFESGLQPQDMADLLSWLRGE